jgi:polyhydroxyalkanoate synthesis regulator phasin
MTTPEIILLITNIDLINQIQSYLKWVDYLLVGIVTIQSIRHWLRKRKIKQKQKEIDALEAKIHDLKNKSCA